jgi:hypothetical protein
MLAQKWIRHKRWRTMSLAEDLRSLGLLGPFLASFLGHPSIAIKNVLNGILPAPWDSVITPSASLGLRVVATRKRTRTRIFRFAQKTINKIENLRKRKTCGQCRFFINSNRNLCEKLNLVHGPISTEVRLRLGYGICVVKAKMVRRGAMTCSDFTEVA